MRPCNQKIWFNAAAKTTEKTISPANVRLIIRVNSLRRSRAFFFWVKVVASFFGQGIRLSHSGSGGLGSLLLLPDAQLRYPALIHGRYLAVQAIRVKGFTGFGDIA